MNSQSNLEKQFKDPENITSERILLAGLIQNSNLLQNTVGVTNSEIFSQENHRAIFKAITSIYKNGEPVAFLQISNWLIAYNNHKCTKELADIEEVSRQTINSEVFHKHLYLIIDKFLRHSLIKDTQFLLKMLDQETKSITSIINEFETVLLKLTKNYNIINNKTTLQSVLPSIITEIKEKTENRKSRNGLSSGFDSLDDLTDGFQNSDLIIIASRPGMGKTALVLNIARNIVKQYDTTLAFFSLEMTAEQLGYRILSCESRVPLSQLKQGQVLTKEWNQIYSAVQTLSKTKLYIDDTPNITIGKLRNQISRISQNNGQLSAVIIDYLQLIESDFNNESRYQQLSVITRSLKIIAREFNIPLIVLSQLSRNLESRSNKRPILADLKESGCIARHSYINFHNNNLKISKLSIVLQKTASTINTNSSIVASSIKKVYVSKNKMVYHLLTESGYYLEASANHKILTNNGWKQLSSIKRQEFIGLVHRQTHIHDFPQIQINTCHFSQLRFDKVESIYVNKKDHLFDLEMNHVHNFVCNKIIVHNSIEQDADVVCMLYRDAYYETSEIENNIAEVSILKHRNGPTGKVELQFDSKFAEFKQNNTP